MYIHIAQKGKMGCKNGEKTEFSNKCCSTYCSVFHFLLFSSKEMAILQKKIETNDREIGFSKYGLSNINVGNLRRKKHLSTCH